MVSKWLQQYILLRMFVIVQMHRLCFYPAKSIRITCISTSFTKTTGKVCNYFCIFNTIIVNIGYILLNFRDLFCLLDNSATND